MLINAAVTPILLYRICSASWQISKITVYLLVWTLTHTLFQNILDKEQQRHNLHFLPLIGCPQGY